MSFLLDTSVVSEWTRPAPDAGVLAWLGAADEDRLHLSVVTLAELRRGVDRLAPGRRRRALDAWLLHDLPERFAGRILAVDAPVADRWGRIVAAREAAGRPIGAIDAALAATAAVHGLTLVTRNVADFRGAVAAILNPWAV